MYDKFENANEVAGDLSIASASHLALRTSRSSSQISQGAEMKGRLNMKKIMVMGAAALCAAVGFSDVTSANVVGFNNITLRRGSYITGSSFDMITKAGMRLTDLKPTGYEYTYWQTGRGNGKFNDMVTIDLLTYQGKPEKTWKWLASYDKTAKVWTGYWYDTADTTKAPIVAGSDEDYEFTVGQGIYVSVAANAYGGQTGAAVDQYKLVNSGAAMMDSQQITLRRGSKGVVAPLSRAVRLTELKPTGYQYTYWQTGRGNGKFNDMVTIDLLTYQGKPEKTWKWLATYDKTAKVWTGYWYDTADATKAPIVAGSEADREFKLGEGIYVSVAANAYGGQTGAADDQYSLEFPGLDDDNRVTE